VPFRLAAPRPRPCAPALAGLALAFVGASAVRAKEPALSREAAWLAEYVAIDSSNPPGNEAAAAAYLAGLLSGAGLASERQATPAGRVNLIAQLPATGPGAAAAPAIVLLHHLDVVPPGPGWSAPPFGAAVVDGALVGRGAIDAKSLGIAHLAAYLDAAKLPERRRALLFLAVADEENGGGEGMAWLAAHRSDLFSNVEAVFAEGGLNRTVLGRTLFWGIEVAQKRALWLELTARGRPGHASSLNPESAAHTLVRALARALDRPPEWKLQAPVAAYLRALGRIDPTLRSFAEEPAAALGPDGPSRLFPAVMSGLLLDTLQVTTLAASERTNVVAAEARARLDVRLLPETDADAYLVELKRALGDELEVEVLLSSPPAPPSPGEGAVWRALEAVLGAEAPLVPAMIPGITDARYFRERGIPAYGVSPFEIEGLLLRRVHGPDEAIPLAVFDRGVARTVRLVRALVAP
jgi:acetylornithine deacetylase/succinyl-diaminopimelate desuccinylase-like protein